MLAIIEKGVLVIDGQVLRIGEGVLVIEIELRRIEQRIERIEVELVGCLGRPCGNARARWRGLKDFSGRELVQGGDGEAESEGEPVEDLARPPASVPALDGAQRGARNPCAVRGLVRRKAESFSTPARSAAYPNGQHPGGTPLPSGSRGKHASG